MGNETAVKEEMYTPQTFSVDEVGGEESIVDEKETLADEEEIEVEGKSKEEVTTDETEAVKLRRELQGLKDEILQLSTRREEKPKEVEPKKEQLTRTQLVNILKEHKDDPEVVLNVIDYLAEQKAESTRDATLKDVNYRQWSSNLSGIANRILSDDEDGYLAANPKVKGSLSEYASNLGLADHPVGQLAAYAIMRLSEQVKAKAKGDEKSTKAEKTTTTSRVMDKTRTTNKLDKAFGLTEEQLATAKKFEVDPKLYAQFVKRS